MSGTADPWEPPSSPALQHHLQRTPSLERTPAPERIYVPAEADPTWQPRPVGFTAQVTPCTGRHCATHTGGTP